MTMTSVKLIVGILLLAVVVEGRWPCKKAVVKLDKCRDNGYVIGDCVVGEGSLSNKQRGRCDDLKTKYEETCSDAYECDVKEAEVVWTAVEKEIKIPFDLESRALQVKTDSPLGSGHEMDVKFWTAEGDYAGGVYIDWFSSHAYKIESCHGNYEDFQTNPPSEVEKVWTISKLPGPRVVVQCNGVTVADITLSNGECYKSDWSTNWNRDVAEIEFRFNDSASDEWRPAPPGTSE